MSKKRPFQSWVGMFAVIAGVLALLSLVVGLAGVSYDFDVFSDTSSLIAAGSAAAGFIRWSYWMNMVGNYLFLVPLALLLHNKLSQTQPQFSQLYMVSGLFYMLLGAAGSAILAATWPYLIEQYATAASTVQQELLIQNFQLSNQIAEVGLHGVIQNFCGAVWFLGVGSLLRTKQSKLGLFAMVVGAFLILNTLGNMFNVEALSLLGLMANILLGPIWSIWIGSSLIGLKAA